jgi:hypothetical protein
MGYETIVPDENELETPTASSTTFNTQICPPPLSSPQNTIVWLARVLSVQLERRFEWHQCVQLMGKTALRTRG